MGLVIEQMRNMASAGIAFACLAVCHPLSLEPCYFAVPDDQRNGARNALVVDVVLHGRRDALQTIGRESDRFRFSRRQILRERDEM